MKNLSLANYLKNIGVLVVVWALSIGGAYAGESSQPNLQNDWYIAAFGGIAAGQTGDGEISATPGGALVGLLQTTDLKTDSNIGGTGGLKIGREFDAFTSVGSFNLIPVLEGEVFYTGYTYKGDAPSVNSSLDTSIDMVTFSFNPILKARSGSFAPYMGFGLGGTYVHLEDTKISGFATTDHEEEDFVVTVQGLAGLEYNITEQWGLFTEYKYVHLIDTKFEASDLTAHFDGLGNHLVTAGLKFKF